MKNHHIYKTRSPFARVLAVLSVFTLLLAPGTLAGEPAPLPTEESAGSLHRLGARNCPASWYTGPQCSSADAAASICCCAPKGKAPVTVANVRITTRRTVTSVVTIRSTAALRIITKQVNAAVKADARKLEDLEDSHSSRSVPAPVYPAAEHEEGALEVGDLIPDDVEVEAAYFESERAMLPETNEDGVSVELSVDPAEDTTADHLLARNSGGRAGRCPSCPSDVIAASGWQKYPQAALCCPMARTSTRFVTKTVSAKATTKRITHTVFLTRTSTFTSTLGARQTLSGSVAASVAAVNRNQVLLSVDAVTGRSTSAQLPASGQRVVVFSPDYSEGSANPANITHGVAYSDGTGEFRLLLPQLPSGISVFIALDGETRTPLASYPSWTNSLSQDPLALAANRPASPYADEIPAIVSQSSKVNVKGTADPSNTVNIYVGAKLVARTKAGSTGSFSASFTAGSVPIEPAGNTKARIGVTQTDSATGIESGPLVIGTVSLTASPTPTVTVAKLDRSVALPTCQPGITYGYIPSFPFRGSTGAPPFWSLAIGPILPGQYVGNLVTGASEYAGQPADLATDPNPAACSSGPGTGNGCGHSSGSVAIVVDALGVAAQYRLFKGYVASSAHMFYSCSPFLGDETPSTFPVMRTAPSDERTPAERLVDSFYNGPRFTLRSKGNFPSCPNGLYLMLRTSVACSKQTVTTTKRVAATP